MSKAHRTYPHIHPAAMAVAIALSQVIEEKEDSPELGLTDVVKTFLQSKAPLDIDMGYKLSNWLNITEELYPRDSILQFSTLMSCHGVFQCHSTARKWKDVFLHPVPADLLADMAAGLVVSNGKKWPEFWGEVQRSIQLTKKVEPSAVVPLNNNRPEIF